MSMGGRVTRPQKLLNTSFLSLGFIYYLDIQYIFIIHLFILYNINIYIYLYIYIYSLGKYSIHVFEGMPIDFHSPLLQCRGRAQYKR